MEHQKEHRVPGAAERSGRYCAPRSFEDYRRSIDWPQHQRLAPRDVVLKENTDDADNPIEVLLNGYHFMDPITDFIKAGTTETWQWINLTVDAHPMHQHLVTFQVVNRQMFDVDGYTTAWLAYLASGRTTPRPDVSNYLIRHPISGSGGDGLQGYREGIPRLRNEDKGSVHPAPRPPSWILTPRPEASAIGFTVATSSNTRKTI